MADEQQTEDTPGDGDDVVWTDGVDDNGHTDSWARLGGQSSIDDMARTLSTFGMRLDALVTSTTSYRAAITDRLVEYADTVNKLVKHQSADLEEHRLANQRLLAELQRGVSTSDETVGRLGDRLDELLRADGGDDTSRQILSEVRSVLDAQERLGQFLTEALDQFGDRVTERLDAGQTGNVAQLDSLVATLDVAQRSERALESDLSEVSTDLRSIREAIVDLASGDVVAALWDEVRVLRDGLSGDGGASFFSGAPDPAEMSRLTDAVRDLLDAAEIVPPEDPAVLAGLSADLAQLRADLSEGLLVEPDVTLDETLTSIKSVVGGIEERVSALAAAASDDSATRELRDEVARLADDATTGQLRDQIARLADEVRGLLERLELVDDGDDETPSATDARLAEVAAEVTAVRDSLAQGVAARPTAELSDTLAAIRTGVDSLADRLDDLASDTDGVRWPGGSLPGEPEEPDTRVADEMQRLADELRAARTEVSAISERLDEGLVIDAPTDGEVVEHVSAMRREVTAELEAVRQILADAVDRPDTATVADDEVELVVDLDPVVALVDELRNEIRSIPTAVAQIPSPGRDEGALDELRDEVRALAGMPESLVESLRAELVALRRRIKVRSDADVLTDDQLDGIAQAVADRLA